MNVFQSNGKQSEQQCPHQDKIRQFHDNNMQFHAYKLGNDSKQQDEQLAEAIFGEAVSIEEMALLSASGRLSALSDFSVLSQFSTLQLPSPSPSVLSRRSSAVSLDLHQQLPPDLQAQMRFSPVSPSESYSINTPINQVNNFNIFNQFIPGDLADHASFMPTASCNYSPAFLGASLFSVPLYSSSPLPLFNPHFTTMPLSPPQDLNSQLLRNSMLTTTLDPLEFQHKPDYQYTSKQQEPQRESQQKHQQQQQIQAPQKTKIMVTTEKSIVDLLSRKPKRKAVKSTSNGILDNRPRDHICKICSSAFLRKQDLFRHESTHSDVRNFLCQYGCGASFGRSDGVTRHMRRNCCARAPVSSKQDA